MMNDDSPETMPRIVVDDPPVTPGERLVSALGGLNPIGVLLAALADNGETARAGIRSLVWALIEEGRSYAETPDGRRWSDLLQSSSAIAKGWMLWNQANIDYYLRNAEPLADSPAALFRAAMRELEHADLATMLSDLSRLSAELDAATVTTGRATQA